MSATTDVITVIEREKVTLLNDLHRRCQASYGHMLELAIEAGRVLLSIKADLRHGEFGGWLEQHFDGAERTAQLYMQLASAPELEDPQRVADLSLRGAVKQISKPRRMSAGEMGAIFAGQIEPPPSPAAPGPPASAPAWSDVQLRKDSRATELLADARSLQESAQDFNDPRSIARAYRDAAVRARRAAAALDELAISFER